MHNGAFRVRWHLVVRLGRIFKQWPRAKYRAKDAAPAGVSTKQLQLKKTRSIAKPPGENTTALRDPDRDPKLCLLIPQVRFSAALFRRLIVSASSCDVVLILFPITGVKIAASRFRPVI